MQHYSMLGVRSAISVFASGEFVFYVFVAPK
jgi:hypothetical protein